MEVTESAGETRPVRPIAFESVRAVEGLGGGRMEGLRDGTEL